MPRRTSDDESLREALADLRGTVEELRDQMRVLTTAIDDLTLELQWRNRQSQDDRYSSRNPVITSMPLDPSADDWEINRLSPADLPQEAVPATSPRRHSLFD